MLELKMGNEFPKLGYDLHLAIDVRATRIYEYSPTPIYLSFVDSVNYVKAMSEEVASYANCELGLLLNWPTDRSMTKAQYKKKRAYNRHFEWEFYHEEKMRII